MVRSRSAKCTKDFLHKSDVRIGDKIMSVNGNTAVNRTVDNITEYMKGQKGTSVKIVFKREGVAEPIENDCS